MKDKNNVERFYNKTTKQIMRLEPIFTTVSGDYVIGISLDTDRETDYYDGYETHEIKRGQMVMCENGRIDRIKRSYNGKDLFITEP